MEEISVEESIEFKLQLLTHSCLLANIASASSKYFRKQFEESALEDGRWHKYRIIAGFTVRDIAYEVSRNAMDDYKISFGSLVVRDALIPLSFPLLSNSSSTSEEIMKQMIENVCKAIIPQRKKAEITLRDKFKNKFLGEIPNATVRICYVRCLLAGCGKKEMEKLKQTTPLLLHIICYNIEKLIRVYGKFEEEDEHSLIEELVTFKRMLNIENSYDRIFHYGINNTNSDINRKTNGDANSNISKMLNVRLPNVLTNTILSYTTLSVMDSEDEDEILHRICS